MALSSIKFQASQFLGLGHPYFCIDLAYVIILSSVRSGSGPKNGSGGNKVCKSPNARALACRDQQVSICSVHATQRCLVDDRCSVAHSIHNVLILSSDKILRNVDGALEVLGWRDRFCRYLSGTTGTALLQVTRSWAKSASYLVGWTASVAGSGAGSFRGISKPLKVGEKIIEIEV